MVMVVAVGVGVGEGGTKTEWFLRSFFPAKDKSLAKCANSADIVRHVDPAFYAKQTTHRPQIPPPQQQQYFREAFTIAPGRREADRQIDGCVRAFCGWLCACILQMVVRVHSIFQSFLTFKKKARGQSIKRLHGWGGAGFGSWQRRCPERRKPVSPLDFSIHHSSSFCRGF